MGIIWRRNCQSRRIIRGMYSKAARAGGPPKRRATIPLRRDLRDFALTFEDPCAMLETRTR